MCGIFGFITKDGRGPKLARLKRIAVETQFRGQHAFGLAWLGDDGKLHTFKRPGPASANLDDLDSCRGATVVVSTDGDVARRRLGNTTPARLTVAAIVDAVHQPAGSAK